MRYEMMLPHQIRAAIEARWPVVLPLGVLEYHGEHMSVGMDTLAVTGILDILDREMNLVILPPFYYGAASYAVEPPERSGTLHVDAEALVPFAKAMFARPAAHRLPKHTRRRPSSDREFRRPACRLTSPSSSPPGRPSSPFLNGSAERAGGGTEKWPTITRSNPAGDDPFNWIKTHPADDARRHGRLPFRSRRRGRNVAYHGAYA